jgi:hypothetical protein
LACTFDGWVFFLKGLQNPLIMGILNFLKVIEPLVMDICNFFFFQKLVKSIVDYFVYLIEGHQTGACVYGTSQRTRNYQWIQTWGTKLHKLHILLYFEDEL